MKVFILTRKRLAALAAALAVVVCAGVTGVQHSKLAVAVNAGERHIPIYSVSTEKKQVSLSFDAAWGNEYTKPLLDILEKNNIKSTFFLVGDWVRSYPDDVKMIADAGHDIGNHSDTHPYLTELDGDGIKNEIDKCNIEIEKLTGKRPTLFRPPYGDYNNSVVDTVRGMEMYCIQWSIDSLDWQDPSCDEIVQNVKSKLAPGAIILMHNGAKNTPEALPLVIDCIRSQGYEIVPISQLLPKGEYTTDANGTMIAREQTIKKECSDSDKNAVRTAAEVESRTSSASSVTSSSSGSSKPAVRPAEKSTSSTGSKAASNSSVKSTTSVVSYQGLAGELYNKDKQKTKQ